MIGGELHHRSLHLLLVLTLILLSLADQVRTPFEIDLGQQCDEIHLRNLWGAKTANDLSYRSSSDRASIFLPGIGGYAPSHLRLRMNGFRSAGFRLPRVSTTAGEQELASWPNVIGIAQRIVMHRSRPYWVSTAVAPRNASS